MLESIQDLLVRENLIKPVALDVDFFVTAADISAAAVGASLTLTAAAARPLYHARMPSITTVDNSGTNLSVTVRIAGRRFGKLFYQDITATGAGGGETVSGTHVIDEIVSCKIVAISNNAASDTVAVGFDGKWLGLSKPFKSYKSIKMMLRVDNGTPETTPRVYTDLSTTTALGGRNSAVNVAALFSNDTIDGVEDYCFEYLADEPMLLPSGGLRFAGN